MNDKINLCEILKDCPKGTILYSPLAGEVEFYGIEGNGNLPIRVMLKGDLNTMVIHGVCAEDIMEWKYLLTEK